MERNQERHREKAVDIEGQIENRTEKTEKLQSATTEEPLNVSTLMFLSSPSTRQGGQ